MARTRRAAAATATPEAPAPESDTAEDAAAKETAAAKRAEQQAARAAERERQEAEQTKTLLERFGEHPAVPDGKEGEESLGAVAKDLNITSGKAAYLLMKDAVAKGKVPAITGADDEALLKAINDARLAVDRYSAWGWLSARASKPEGWIKTGLEKMGLFTPKAENIASKRAELNKPEPSEETETPATDGEKPKTGTRRRRGNAS